MSETSSEVSTDSDREGQCRDFLRGVCDRHRCKFTHDKPEQTTLPLANMNNGTGAMVLNFCHDYQNNSCPRPNCRFIHCTPAEEEQFKRTGELPLHLQADAIRKHQLAFTSQPPVCKNFLNGDCRRSSCKYRHISRVEHEAEIQRTLKLQPPADIEVFEQVEPVTNLRAIVPDVRPRIGFVNGNGLRRNGSNFNSFGEYGPPDVKRRFFAQSKIEFVENNGFEMPECDLDIRGLRMNGYFNGNSPTNALLARLDPRVIMLEDEVTLLHKQVQELKKQVSDLTATNEFLLDQNAQLRVSSKRNGNVTSVTVPAVTITNTTVPPINTSGPPPQQMIRTLTASVATVPVSIATVTACNPVSMGAVSMAPVGNPVTIGTVSMAPVGNPVTLGAVSMASVGNPVSMGAVSMAPIQAVPAVSIAQPAAQQMLAQSQQLAQQNQQLLANPTNQLTLANSSTQLAIAQQNLANNLAQQTQQNLANISQQTQQNLANNLAQQTQQNLANNLAQQTQQNLANNLAQQTQQNLANNLAQQTQQNLANNLAQQTQQNLANNLAQQTPMSNQQLTSQAQQLALAASTPQQLTSQAQQLASQQLMAQQTLASSQQLLNGTTQLNGAISTSQAIAMSNASQPMVSYPIMTQSVLQNGLQH